MLSGLTIFNTRTMMNANDEQNAMWNIVNANGRALADRLLFNYSRRSDDEDDDDDEDFEESEEVHAMQDEEDEEAVTRTYGMPRLSDKDTPPLEHALTHELALKTAAIPYPQNAPQLGTRMSALKLLTLREFNGHRGRILNGNSTCSGFSAAQRCHLASRCIPRWCNNVDSMNSRAYIGQFSSDGSMFVAGYQDRRIKVYDVFNRWKLRKDILVPNLRWTVTDTSLSPDQRFLVYSSIIPVAYLVNVAAQREEVESRGNVNELHHGLYFGMSADSGRERQFGIWSLEFSADSREIVAGASDQNVYVYDVEANRVAARVNAHTDDVNAVTFADARSSIIFSGSDDRLVKVWDRRMMSKKRSKAQGVLLGHTEGITSLAAKGDGYYVISNSKDQSIKLWDIRKMMDSDAYEKMPPVKLHDFHWDYRWTEYPGTGLDVRHPNDSSLMTYRGHRVLQTLIRCYFSPEATTGQKYIYTGSHSGEVYIYDLVTGKTVDVLRNHEATVRDCSWHPTLPLIASVSWDGRIVRWEYLNGNDIQDVHCQSLHPRNQSTRCMDVLTGRSPLMCTGCSQLCTHRRCWLHASARPAHPSLDVVAADVSVMHVQHGPAMQGVFLVDSPSETHLGYRHSKMPARKDPTTLYPPRNCPCRPDKWTTMVAAKVIHTVRITTRTLATVLKA
eukprot:jgi/Mesvir1/23876/Mv10669-RA.1